MAIFEDRNFIAREDAPFIFNINKRRFLFGVFCFVIFFIIILYFGTVNSIVDIWLRSDTFAHGFLIVPISCYMIWTKKKELFSTEVYVSYWGLLPLFVLCSLWFAAYLGKVLVVQQMALVGMIPAVVFCIFGVKITKVILFPLFYLIFIVPFGSDLVPILMDFTASFTVQGLKLTGIPVFWEGRYIVIPSGSFVVAEACSGLRYLIASIALGCLYAYLNYQSLWRRLAFIGVAIAVPIVANGLRAYSIVIIAHYSNMKLAVGVDHVIYGWLFFGLVILIMFWIGSWWRESPANMEQDSVKHFDKKSTSSGVKDFLIILGVAITVIASGPMTVDWIQSREFKTNSVILQIPADKQNWKLTEALNQKWRPTYGGANGEIQVRYVNIKNGKPIDLYVGYFEQQQQGAELINSENSLYNRDNWRLVSHYNEKVQLKNREMVVNKLLLNFENNKRLIWYWYWVSGYTTTSDILTKILEVWDRLSGSNKGSAVVAISSEFEITEAEADMLIASFVGDFKLDTGDLFNNR